MSDFDDPPFGIYIHWPFCQSLCPYCDFNTYTRDTVAQDLWCQGYLSELEAYAATISLKTCRSVYFGGGTPSLMAPDTSKRIIERVAELWNLDAEAEITLEANPTSVEAETFDRFRRAGINRVSLGIQSLRNSDLVRLGRRHTAEEAKEAYCRARDEFTNVSIDLMFGRPFQTIDDWQHELEDALELKPTHLSLYQLTIEPGTVFGKLHAAGKLRGIPDEESLADMFVLNNAICEESGLFRYEVSNHARQNYEGLHNLLYWRYLPFLGIGPGAHGRIKVDDEYYRTETVARPDAWLEAVRNTGSGESLRQPIHSWERAEEYLMMGLRLKEGIQISRFNSTAGIPMDEQAVQRLVADGLMNRQGDNLTTTDRGVLVLNRVATELLLTETSKLH